MEKKGRILIVEDEVIIAEDLGITISDMGYEVAGSVTSAKDALKKALELKPDLILMDIVLSGKKNGIDASEEIKKKMDIPIIFLTAYSDLDFIDRAKSIEPYAYLVKPFQPRQLLASIEIALYKSRMEKKLHEVQEWFSKTLRSIGDCVIATDSKGHVKFMNTVAEAVTGWKMDEAAGKPVKVVFNIINEETGEPAEDHVTRVIREGNVVGLANHTLLITRDGAKIPIMDSGAPIRDDQGNIIGVVLVFQDITERMQAERDRITLQAAEQASRAKSAFVAYMSHEIRTPLNAILGFAQVLERDPALLPRQAEHVRTISSSGNHLLLLINDILDLSKIEAGQAILNPAAFCLYDLLSDVEMMFHSRADAKGLRLLVERDESVPRYVIADERKLRQVFINLIGNAINFTEKGGVTVRVRVEAVEEKTVAGKEALRLVAEVQDSGPGIAARDIDLIFAMFQQAKSAMKAGGTGLGLAISRKLVEMMGGKLTVTSQVGQGSCFRFDVLLKRAEDTVKPGKTASRRVVGLESGTGPFRILVVDDRADNRAFLCQLLRPVGFEVAEASNGVEALEISEWWSPHVVLMDMRMPVMDGYEATRRLKSTAAGRNISIIAVTTVAFEDNKEQILTTGVDAYLSKPFRHEELFAVLGKCLGLRYVFADEIDKTPGRLKPPPLTPEALAALPKELIRAMRQAVAAGDIARLTELIAQVEKVDGAAARELQALADRYDYEKISQWLEKGGPDNE